jgi:hypothetical protein
MSIRELKKVPKKKKERSYGPATEYVNIADVKTFLRSHHNDMFTRCAVMDSSSNHKQRIEWFLQYLR